MCGDNRWRYLSVFRSAEAFLAPPGVNVHICQSYLLLVFAEGSKVHPYSPIIRVMAHVETKFQWFPGLYFWTAIDKEKRLQQYAGVRNQSPMHWSGQRSRRPQTETRVCVSPVKTHVLVHTDYRQEVFSKQNMTNSKLSIVRDSKTVSKNKRLCNDK